METGNNFIVFYIIGVIIISYVIFSLLRNKRGDENPDPNKHFMHRKEHKKK